MKSENRQVLIVSADEGGGGQRTMSRDRHRHKTGGWMWGMSIALVYPLQRDLFILIICFCSIDLLMKNENSKCISSEQTLCTVCALVCVFGRYNRNTNYVIESCLSFRENHNYVCFSSALPVYAPTSLIHQSGNMFAFTKKCTKITR